MSFSEKNENKKKIYRGYFLIKSFENISFSYSEKRHFSIYKTRPVSVTMEMDRKNIMY